MFPMTRQHVKVVVLLWSAIVLAGVVARCFAAEPPKPIDLTDAVVPAVKGPAEFSLTGPEQIKTTESAHLSATGLPPIDLENLKESLAWRKHVKFSVLGPKNAQPKLRVILVFDLAAEGTELDIVFTADKPGNYWIVGNWYQEPFGFAAHNITVVAPGPPPVGQLKAEPPEIYKGGSSQLVWSATGADSAKDEAGKDVPVSGQATVSPAETTTYMRTWEGPGGTTQASAQVTVAPFPPPAATLSVTPEEIQLGQSALWTWGTANTSAQLLDNKPVPEEGSEETTPATAGSVTRKLVVTGLDGKQRPPVTATLKVTQPSAPIPLAGLHVLIVHDPTAGALPPAQQSIITSDILRSYFRANCAKDKDGVPQFKIIAPSSNLSLMDKHWRDAAAKYKLTSPAWIVSNHPVGGEVGPLPANVDEAGKVLERWTQVKFARGPPPQAVKLHQVTDADLPDASGVVKIGAEEKKCGALPRPAGRPRLRGMASFAASGIQMIPQTEWGPRWTQLTKDKARIQDVILGAGISANDQNGYGLCWCFAACGSHQIRSLVQNNHLVLPSVASCAGNIYPNDWGVNGGWPGEAVEYLANKGGVHVSLWPMLGLKQSYSTPEGEADRSNHRNVTYVELGASGNMWNEYVSCVLQGIPICVTYSWWSHAVTGVGITGSGEASVIWNSWGNSYGTQGFGEITGSRRVPDEAYAILETTHSECRTPAVKPQAKADAKPVVPPIALEDQKPATEPTVTLLPSGYWSNQGYYVIPNGSTNRNGPSYARLPGG